MPREKISITDKIEYLSILNEKGQLDDTLEPNIGEDVLFKLHRFERKAHHSPQPAHAG